MKKAVLTLLPMLIVSATLLGGCNKNPEDVLLAQITSENVVKIAVSADDAPYSYKKSSNSDEYDGIEVKIAAQLAKGLGAEMEVVPVERENLLQTLADGRAQLALGRLPTTLTEHNANVDASVTYLSGNIYTVTKRGNTVSTRGAMEGKVILCSEEMTTDTMYRFGDISNATVLQNDGSVDVESYLVEGLLDVYVCYKNEAELMASNDLLQAQVATNIAAENYAVFTLKDNGKLLKAVNEMVAEMADEGIIDDIVNSF